MILAAPMLPSPSMGSSDGDHAKYDPPLLPYASFADFGVKSISIFPCVFFSATKQNQIFFDDESSALTAAVLYRDFQSTSIRTALQLFYFFWIIRFSLEFFLDYDKIIIDYGWCGDL